MTATVLLLVLVIVYHYALFPVLLLLISKLRPSPALAAQDATISVSFIVAAYNEEKVLQQKLTNCFKLDYPAHLIEFIFVTDGSTDRSCEIIQEYSNKGVVGLHDPPRRGKTSALNRAMQVARGEVVVFSDANSMFDPRAVLLLLQYFADPSVGGVCGRKGIVKNFGRAASQGDSFYWSVESIIKLLQSRIGSISTGDGEIFAIRRKLYRNIPAHVINDDNAITFNILSQGYRVIYEPAAVTYEEASLTLKDDFNVKVRMVAGGYQTLQLYGGMLCRQMPCFFAQFFSHKVLRWFMPVLLILLLASNILALLQAPIHYLPALQLLLVLQLLFYFIACLGRCTRWGTFYFPYYYVLMNLAALVGLWRFVNGNLGTGIWKKAER